MFKKENNKVESCYKKKQQQAAIASIFSYKHLKKVYPVGLNRSSSSLSSSLSSSSSLSLSLSQNSNDDSSSVLTDHSASSTIEHKVSLALRLIAPPHRRGPPPPMRPEEVNDGCGGGGEGDEGEPRRKSFAGFDPNIVAKMEEKEIMDIVSDKAISLAECRVRCIVDNAKCILKIVREFGSFSSYMWGHMNHKPTINKFRYPRNVPLRSPKAEAMSRELLRRGFRFVGPVIVYSFMQAAGLTIDHLVDCFRYKECVALAERPWRHM
ncbi:Probable GMP synthase [glutamine-hydrolyzing] [Linum perenne]